MEDNVRKHKIYIDIEPTVSGAVGTVGTTGVTIDNSEVFYKIKHSDGTFHNYPENDFYINIPVYKSERVFEYIDLQREDAIHTVQRQEINPFFIEYEFFNSVTFSRINKGDDLDDNNISFIKSVVSEVANSSDSYVREWYDNAGKFKFPWNAGTPNEVTKDDLDKSSMNKDGIVSKSTVYPIDINN